MGRVVEAGLFAEEIHKGTMIDGRRVETMTTGPVSGLRTITVRFAELDRKGRQRLSAPVSYRAGTRVPGTRTPTTWAMPAGPVGRKPGTESNGGWWGNDGGSPTDRHQRRMEALTYA